MERERTQETTAIVTGLGLAGVALFCGLSLWSYVPTDVMDYTAGSSGKTGNLGGLLGARAAHHLLCLYGTGAWTIVASLLIFGVMICAARSMSGMLLRASGSILLTLLVCTWAALGQGGTAAFAGDMPAGPGGILGGHYLAPPLVGYFGPVGVYLVLVTGLLLSGLMIAQDATESVLALLGRGCVKLAHWSWDSITGRLQTLAAPQPVPAAAAVSARSGIATPKKEETEAMQRNDRIAVLDAPLVETRRNRNLPAKVEKEEEEQEELQVEVPPEAVSNRGVKKEPKPEPKVREEKVSPAEAEEEKARARREEAMRQAEEAERQRLEREKVEREKVAQESKALEKLEKERQAKEKERQKAQAKFFESMNKNKDEAGEETKEAKQKPRLPDDYRLPELKSMEAKDTAIEISSDALKDRGIKLIETLWEFKIGSRLVGISHGPTVTMFELSLDAGINVRRVTALSDNLAMAMKAEHGIRIIAPLPGRDTIGIEIPNTEDHVVRMRPILESTAFRSCSHALPLVLGRDSTGNPLIADLSRMPHLLIAGTTGSGKSVCINSIILSLMILKRPQEVKMILVDPKQVEMADFKGIPHLLSPVVTDMKVAAGVLSWAVQKMEDRYDRMLKVGVKNINSFNKLTQEERLARLPQSEPPDNYVDAMPYIVVVVDEFADLMMTAGKEIEQAIARLAQKARAAGIHVILATQRPSADVVTGLIKTNLPCRICFQVKSKVDSRIVLDTGGGEKLAGKGDMLYVPPGTSQLIRAKAVFIGDHEVKAVVDFCKNQAQPIYSDELEKAAAKGVEEEKEGEAMPLDERFEEGVECFLALGRASTSLLQRRLGLGYTRAAKLCDQMEARGIVGPDRGAKGRELLLTQEAWESYKRGNVAGSAWGPKGSKDNPGTPSGDAPASTVDCLDDIDGTREAAEELKAAAEADASDEDHAEAEEATESTETDEVDALDAEVATEADDDGSADEAEEEEEAAEEAEEEEELVGEKSKSGD
ncbi:MAG: DNA translocase FtsK [Planctomycetes bacterium]|nr:DNA translocase FtsK [Planctomycetota bacterium]